MKKLIYKFTWGVLLSVLLLSCTEKEELDFSAPVTKFIKGNIVEDMTIDAGEYKLFGGVKVKEGVTLTINKGVTIKAVDAKYNGDYIACLLVEKGAKLKVNGTADQPVVFTSDTTKAGSWGGIIICGDAPVSGEYKTEYKDLPYGGEVANDNSGSIQYLRIEYAGTKCPYALELSGVGSETLIENVQVYKCSNKAFGFNGGTVNAKNLLISGCKGTMFYWNYGWSGKGQYWFGQRDLEEVTGFQSSTALVGNHDKAETLVSNPTISNVTILGNENSKNLIKLLNNTKGKLYNFILKDQAQTCINVSGTGTINLVNEDELVFQYVSVSNVGKNVYSKGIESGKKFEEDANYVEEEIDFNGYVGTTSNGYDLSVEDNWFDQTDYKGAVSPNNNWTTGWIRE